MQSSQAARNRSDSYQRVSRWLKEMWILWVLVGLTVIMAALSPVFLTPDNLLENIARPAAIVALISIGMTFVIVSRGLDLSVGSNAALSSTVGILAISQLRIPIDVGIVLTLLIGIAFGLVNAFFITRVRVAPFIVTLGMLSVGRGLTLVFTGTSFTYGLPDSYRDWGRAALVGIPVPVLILIGFWLLAIFLYRSRIGIYARAIGSNETSTRLAGVSVDRYLAFYYGFIGLLSALAGILWSARANTISVTTGIGTELDVIASVIIGGTSLFGGAGTVTGSILGAITLTVLANGLQLLGINTFVQRIVIGCVIIIALALGKWRSERAIRARTKAVPNAAS